MAAHDSIRCIGVVDELAREALACNMEAISHASTNDVRNWNPISTPRSSSKLIKDHWLPDVVLL